TAEQRTRFNSMLAELRAFERTCLPPEPPYLMTIADTTPADLNINIRGNPHALGDIVPRGLPAELSDSPEPVAQGTGRLELAPALLRRPLAARVIVTRIWMHHFGRGIVATASNFGNMGERPTHPSCLTILLAVLSSGSDPSSRCIAKSCYPRPISFPRNALPPTNP